jgi:hypothetical protein
MSPRWGSTPTLNDWPTVSHNVTLTLTWEMIESRVEAESNTAIVTLRVVGGDEKGSLESETVKVGPGPENDYAGEVQQQCKRQTRPLIRESSPHQQTHNCLDSNKNQVISSRWVFYSKTDWLTDLRSYYKIQTQKWLKPRPSEHVLESTLHSKVSVYAPAGT